MSNSKFKVNERFGVAEPTLYYVDPIFDKIFGRLHKMMTGDKTFYRRTVTLKYADVRTNVKSRQLYAEFPVIGIELELDFDKVKAEDFEKKYGKDKKINIVGLASGYGAKMFSGDPKITNPIKQVVNEEGIVLILGIEIKASSSLNMSDKSDAYDVANEIRSLIWHELNHCYEYYKRLDGKEPKTYTKWVKTALTCASVDANTWKFGKSIYDFWEKNFTYYIYFTEPHEMRAEIQEIGHHIQKMGIDGYKNSKIWKDIEYMEKFNPSAFHRSLLRLVSEKIPKYLGTERATARRLKDMWVEVYKKQLKEQKQTDKIDIKSIEKMRAMEFLKFWDKRFKERSKYMKRKVMILASHIKQEGF